MTGFVEILSDPSYINQIITFTSSHVGNYGMSKTDFESSEPKIEAAIANSFTYNPSSWRSEKSITDWLNEYNIPFSGGFDVRAITTHLRECLIHGPLQGALQFLHFYSEPRKLRLHE